MSLVTPITVEQLRKALHAKAKEEVGFRFYLLYDKVYRRDVLSHVYALSRAARGAPGVDGETFARIEEQGRERWLDELADGRRGRGGAAQPPAAGLGEFLPSRPGEQGVSSHRPSHRSSAPPVVVWETQDRRPGDAPLPKRVPGLGPGTHAPVSDDAQPSVGVGMILERAGCGKFARPVRRAATGNGVGINRDVAGPPPRQSPTLLNSSG